MNKQDFPIFKTYPDLVYLDSGASAQKPQIVLETMMEFAQKKYANVHRGSYYLSEMATMAYEEARRTVAAFLGARYEDIIFVRGATEAINLVAQTYGHTLKAGDEVLISEAEHHSNIVPWQLLAAERDINLKYVNVLPSGELDLNDFENKLTDKTKLVAITQMSNVLGLLNPIDEIVKKAHKAGAKVLIDGCQAIVHTPIDLRKSDIDFYAFSGHKLYGPTGIGVLYGKSEIMNTLPPWQGGGDMIKQVKLTGSTFADTPARFEAGTPAIIESVGLMSAINYVKSIGYDKMIDNENQVMHLLKEALNSMARVQVLGDLAPKKSLVCFNLKGIHPQDVAMVLSEQNVAVRVGHHCAQPITEKYGVTASIRVSLGLYNDGDDISKFLNALKKAEKILGSVRK